jgi:hypothetical protein
MRRKPIEDMSDAELDELERRLEPKPRPLTFWKLVGAIVVAAVIIFLGLALLQAWAQDREFDRRLAECERLRNPIKNLRCLRALQEDFGIEPGGSP